MLVSAINKQSSEKYLELRKRTNSTTIQVLKMNPHGLIKKFPIGWKRTLYASKEHIILNAYFHMVTFPTLFCLTKLMQFYTQIANPDHNQCLSC